jgi:hypothetical protein
MRKQLVDWDTRRGGGLLIYVSPRKLLVNTRVLRELRPDLFAAGEDVTDRLDGLARRMTAVESKIELLAASQRPPAVQALRGRDS